ncbi:MAG: hypothetical protein JWL61_3056 [Gemmatimonadetes bacterium]|nr:hypothetical protein [Gemmatimonadota bacterium]
MLKQIEDALMLVGIAVGSAVAVAMVLRVGSRWNEDPIHRMVRRHC